MPNMTEVKRSTGLRHPDRPSPYPELNDEAVRLFVRLKSRMNNWPGFADSRIQTHLALALLPLTAVPYMIARNSKPMGAKMDLEGRCYTVAYHSGVYVPTIELEVAWHNYPFEKHKPTEAIIIRACRDRVDSCFAHTTITHDTRSAETIKTLRNNALAIALVEDFIDQI